MSAYAIFDVAIHDPAGYQEFMDRVKPELENAGARFLSRGGEHRVYEGDWEPRRLVLIEFPSLEAFEGFYKGRVYQELKSVRDACSSARLVALRGFD
jgi:uncharacterized protein (DUF1330 family)